MKYFFTLLWTFLLAQMFTYVVGAIKSTPYDFNTGVLLTVGMFLVIILIPLINQMGDAEKNGSR